jgi:DNA-binding transcriptional LysR family regulator
MFAIDKFDEGGNLPMEIRNLITFVQVAELNSFTRAAKALDYSQSTVSFQIKQLEMELGCLLFERINHTISLTEQGRELLAYAQKIRHLTDSFNENRNAARLLEGYIHVVTPDSVCEDMITANYVDFHSHYPGIRLKFTTADTEEMQRMLDHNEADVMLTLDNHIYHSDYVIAMEEPVQMHFVTGADSPYATDRPLELREIADYPFLLTEKGMGYRRAFDEILAQQSLEILPVLEIGRTDLITAMLESGAGISFLPEFVTREKVAAGTLTYLNVTDVQANIWKQLIYHRNKWISRSLDALIGYIKQQEFGKV